MSTAPIREFRSEARLKPHPASQEATFSETVLNSGFIMALVLAFLCFGVASSYMYMYLTHTDSFLTNLAMDSASKRLSAQSINLLVFARLAASRFALLSCGVLAALALGFVGFCLFLVGAKGEIKAEGEAQSAKIRLAHIAPGAFVLFCAIVLIGLCVTHQVIADTTLTSPSTPQQAHHEEPSRSLDDYPDPATDPNP